MTNYIPINIEHLDIIVPRVLTMIPREKLFNSTSPFFIENNKELFLAIPELYSELVRLKLIDHVYGFAIYVLHSSVPLAIHVDNGDIIHSLNIPLSGCENTFVNFYHSEVPAIEKTSSNGNKYFHFAKEHCRVIDRLEMTTPHIIKVKVPHAVVNTNTAPRISMLIRLNDTTGELF